MKNVLVSGMTGFVGKNLERYFSVYPDLKIIPLQLREALPERVSNVDCIIHLAGKAHDLKKAPSPELYYDVNFELTKRLYDKFIASDAKVFIFISSVKAAADLLEGTLTEEFIAAPQTDYGKSKLLAENYIQSVQLPFGKSYYILRPCMIHGPGNKGNLNLLFQFAMRGLPFPLGAFQNERSFLSIDNLCFVLKELITQVAIPTGIYNISDDQPLSTAAVVAIMTHAIGKKPRVWSVEKNLIIGLAKLGDILRLPMNTERLGKLTENYVVANNKIKSALNIVLPLSSSQGLTLTSKSFMTAS